MKTIIDATDCAVGRMASAISERLLKGEKIAVVNVEKAIITGNKKFLIDRYTVRIQKTAKGNPRKSPKFPRTAEAIFKRTVRGMLPRKNQRGMDALKNLKAFIGIPKEIEKEKIEHIQEAKVKEKKKFLYLGELSRLLGAKF